MKQHDWQRTAAKSCRYYTHSNVAHHPIISWTQSGSSTHISHVFFFMFWTLGDAWRQNPTLQFFLATGLAKGPPTSIFLAMTPSTVKNLFLATRAFPPIKYGDTATQYSNTPAVAAFCTFGACACPAALSPPPWWQNPTCHQQGLNGFERVFGELQQRPNFFWLQVWRKPGTPEFHLATEFGENCHAILPNSPTELPRIRQIWRIRQLKKTLSCHVRHDLNMYG
mgnify:FL=1